MIEGFVPVFPTSKALADGRTAERNSRPANAENIPTVSFDNYKEFATAARCANLEYGVTVVQSAYPTAF